MTSLSFLSADWQVQKDARDYLAPLFRSPPLMSRQTFGLLQRPTYSHKQQMDTYSFKVFVCGKSASGKTATVAKLCGHDLPEGYVETPGLQANIGYWPAYISAEKQPVLFRIAFFDAGDAVCRKYDHIQTAGMEGASVVLVVFSLTDRSSFEDAQKRLHEKSQSHACVLVATHADSKGQHQVSEDEIRDASGGCPYVLISNTRGGFEDDQQKVISQIAPLLNQMCDLVMQQGSSS